MKTPASRWRSAGSVLAGLLIAVFGRPAEAKQKRSDATAQEAESPVKVKVRVVDVAGGRAYIEPGAAKHLRVGDTVTLGRKQFQVVAVTDTSAAVDLGDDTLEIGTRGTSSSVENRPIDAAKKLPPPTDLAAFRGDWQAQAPPAQSQRPKRVPLGISEDARRNRVQLSAYSYGVQTDGPDGAGFVGGELRARVHVEPFSSMPLAFDADVSTYYVGPETRSGALRLLRLRELSATYGTDVSFRAALGRLRFASSILGNLDGLRIETPLGAGFRVAAFGGLMPEPQSSTLSTGVVRFGTEVSWQHDSSLEPRVVLGTHASQFDGAIDERKLYAILDFLPRFGQFGASAELSFFDPDNVWNAPTTDLSRAGVFGRVHHGIFFAGGHADFSRPERSRFVASFLPQEWLCRTSPSPTLPEPCIGGDAFYGGGLHAGLRGATTSLTVGTEASSMTNTTTHNTSAYTFFRWLDIYDKLRVDLGVSQASGSFVRATTFTAAPGYTFDGQNVDVTLRYQPALMRYTTDDSPFVQHSVGASLWVSPGRAVDLTLDGELDRGRDINAIIVQTVAVWRPGL